MELRVPIPTTSAVRLRVPVFSGYVVSAVPSRDIPFSFTKLQTGADTEAAISLTHASGAVSSLLTSSRAVGPNVAQIIGTEGRIEIDAVWYTPTTFRVHAPDGSVREEYRSDVQGRGMQYQALHAEQLITEGRTDSALLPIQESVAIMATLDEIRAQLGVVYPS